MPKIQDRNIKCSFCGKPQELVKKIIAGPSGVFICDECVGLCQDIIDEESYDEPLQLSQSMMPILYFRRKTTDIKPGTRVYTNNPNRFSPYVTKGFKVRYTIDKVIKEIYDRGWIIGADNLTMNDFKTMYRKLSLISI